MVSLVAIAANKNRGNLALNRELDKFSIFQIYIDDSKCMFVNKSKVWD